MFVSKTCFCQLRRSRQWVNGGADLPRSIHMPNMAGWCWLQNPSFEDAFPIEHFWIFQPSYGSFRWTNSIINPLLLNFPDPFFGCVVATGWCTKICKFDWVMWYVWPVKETLGSWATWNKQPRGKCDHDHSQLILQKAVQNPQLTSRFCCVFQGVNSCTSPEN